MKLRHAAALALVGWYLMAPPLSLGQPETNAPLSEWAVTGSLDTAEECGTVKTQVVQMAISKFTADSSEHNRSLVDEAKASLCISTDDPRLKGN
jgi:hypothetical protein